jgi:hypothetical protein
MVILFVINNSVLVIETILHCDSLISILKREMTGSSLDDWILLALWLQPLIHTQS